MRCFISLEPSEHIKARIFHEFEKLEKKNLFRGKIVEKDNLHLTLKFLGDISEEEIEKVKKKLSEIDFEKFSCELGDVDFFRNENFIKIVWINLLSEENKISKLQEEISKKLPFFKDKDKFLPHLTTARVKVVLNKELKKELIKEIKKMNFKNLKFDVDKFYLMKSQLFRSGPEHKVIEEFDLK